MENSRRRSLVGSLLIDSELTGGGLVPAASGLPAFKFDPALASFTPSMAKRSTDVFAAAPIVQGNLDGSGTPDYIGINIGDKISDGWYECFDQNQGSIAFFITPEWDGDDNITHFILSYNSWSLFSISKTGTNYLRFAIDSQTVNVDISSWTTGTTYAVVIRWDTKNTLDGTNYACISINDVHTFGISTKPDVNSITPLLYVGSYSAQYPANGIIEGLYIGREVLWDGSHGLDLGVGDVIAQMYNSGSGKDITEILGSWGEVLNVPTNGTAGALVSGEGEAHSHPHSSNLLENGFMNQGYYGKPWSVGFENNVANNIEIPSSAGVDNLPDNEFTLEAFIRFGEEYSFSFNKTAWNISWGTSSGRYSATVSCATTNAVLVVPTQTISADGKWHHLVMYFNDAGDRKIYSALDGKWVTGTQTAGVGAVSSDSGTPLKMRGSSLGWCRISNNARYTVGTDFVPSRTPPAIDANTVGQWNMSEGSGTTVDNAEGTAARDGTITNGTWIPNWVADGDIPTSIEFDGSTTSIVVADDASIQDLADDAFTAEGWFRADSTGEDAHGTLFFKGGFNLYYSAGYIKASVFCATSDAEVLIKIPPDGKFHHWAITFDDAGDRKTRIYKDRVLIGTSVAGVGAIVSDIGYDLYIGARTSTAYSWDGNIDWIRISNTVRDIANETADRFNPPAIDGNTVLQLNMNEGAGNPQDSSGNNNHGVLSNGVWNNTPELSVDESGAMVYNGGYIVGADAADEGFKQTHTGLTAGDDYVVRAVAFTEFPYTGQPALQIYDESNSALIAELEGDWSKEIVANGDFATDTLWNKGVGWSINTGTGKAHCDGSQTGNSYIYLAYVYQQYGGLKLNNLYKVVFTVSNYSAGNVRPRIGDAYGQPVTANGTYTQYVVATDSAFAIYMYADSLFIGDIDNISVTRVPEYNHPDILQLSFELPAGCTSISTKLISKSAGILGVHQVELLPQATNFAVGDFVASTDGIIANAVLQVGAGTVIANSGVCRVTNSSPTLYDPIQLGKVSLTCTPASLANSTENGGIRVDGYDALTQPVTKLTTTRGNVKFKWTPRYDSSLVSELNTTPRLIASVYGDTDNYIKLLDDGSLYMDCKIDGTQTILPVNYTFTGGTDYTFMIAYDADEVLVVINSAVVIYRKIPVEFVTVPTSFIGGE